MTTRVTPPAVTNGGESCMIPLPWPKPPLTGNRTRGNPYARAKEVAGADGTYLTFGPDVNLPKLLAWTRNNAQDGLFA